MAPMLPGKKWLKRPPPSHLRHLGVLLGVLSRGGPGRGEVGGVGPRKVAPLQSAVRLGEGAGYSRADVLFVLVQLVHRLLVLLAVLVLRTVRCRTPHPVLLVAGDFTRVPRRRAIVALDDHPDHGGPAVVPRILDALAGRRALGGHAGALRGRRAEQLRRRRRVHSPLPRADEARRRAAIEVHGPARSRRRATRDDLRHAGLHIHVPRDVLLRLRRAHPHCSLGITLLPLHRRDQLRGAGRRHRAGGGGPSPGLLHGRDSRDRERLLLAVGGLARRR
mmetsp:Transcript_64299/g.153384  ORF Transcript_64299/g.153384 Transcript_64299/m.153384 type:complete len:277 (+) Transcript_64299:146-976(+)